MVGGGGGGGAPPPSLILQKCVIDTQQERELRINEDENKPSISVNIKVNKNILRFFSKFLVCIRGSPENCESDHSGLTSDV